MRSLITCRKTAQRLAALVIGCSALSAQAVTLNFSAILMPGTCTFSLDKSTLALGEISLAQLRPATIVDPQPLTLRVQDCSGTDASLTPVVNISGDGLTLDGRWLFRAADSVARDVGVMLVKTDEPPVYGSTEVRNGDDIILAAQGDDPVDQNLTFYAGVTCGSAGCTSQQLGSLVARVTFNLAYR